MAKIHTQSKLTSVEISGDVGKISVLFAREPDYEHGVVLTLVTPDGKVGGKIAMEETTFQVFLAEIAKL